MDKVKTPRYRAGQLPVYAKEAQSVPDDPKIFDDVKPAVQKQEVTDRRLARTSKPVDKEEAMARHRHARNSEIAEVVTAPAPQGNVLDGRSSRSPHAMFPSATLKRPAPALQEDPEMNEAEAAEAAEEAAEREAEENEKRRARIRQMREQAEAAAAAAAAAEKTSAAKQEEMEEAAEGSSSYEEEDEESEASLPGISKLPPPVFRPKAERDTVKDREAQEAEEARLEAERQKEIAARAAESQALLKEEMQRAKEEMEAAQSDDEGAGDDEGDEKVEYEAWKLRELARVKREKEEIERLRKEEEEVSRRRGMTDEEIQRLDRDRLAKQDKAKWNFLQKYWHKGAFYQDQDILARDYNAPTEADRIDKTNLPKVMQVKNFGRAGRTKYTHLTDQDTTKFDAGWAAKDNPMITRIIKQMGGVGPVNQKR
jgi:microfibrillar-associated protein 1